MNERRPRRPGASPADPGLLGALDLLWTRRAPYGGLLAEVVAEALDRFPPPPELGQIEIGSGGGQLRAWLPPSWRDTVIHTDPSGAALRTLRGRDPGARLGIASAERLPFATGALGAVLGLCVFDALRDVSVAVEEVARVLAPGGRFVHLMDMATLLEAPFEKLAAAGLVPIPNLFGDPGDHEWPLDILLIKRDWLRGLLGLDARAGQPLARIFGRYFRSFEAEPFDTATTTGLFKAIASSSEQRTLLARALESATSLALAQGYPPIQPLPFHSGKYLQSVLESSFRNSPHFRVERSAIVARASWQEPSPGQPKRYRSLCLGHQRIMDEFPSRFLCAESGPEVRRRGDGGELDAGALVEAAAFVFVATRSAD